VKKTAAVLFFSFLFVNVNAQKPSPSELTNEQSFKEYFVNYNATLDEIEGIWQVSTKQYFYKYDTLYDVIVAKKAARVAIVQHNGKYESYILTGESYNVEFTKTDVAGVYFYRNYFNETDEYSKTDAVISKQGEMKYEYEIPEKLLRLRMEDLFEEGIHVTNEVQWIKTFPIEGKKKK
jgi:hypothetical protein